MSKAFINIGSGSVKLLLKGDTLATMTLLASGDITSTLDAVVFYYNLAVSSGQTVHIFGTEAVRRNPHICALIKQAIGLDVDIIDGKTEALCGFLGAKSGSHSIAVMDVGGASTELSAGLNQPDYAVSLPIGAVDAHTKFKAQGLEKITAYIDEYVHTLTPPPFDEAVAIGGSALSIGAVLLNQRSFDASALNGKQLGAQDIYSLSVALLHLSEADRIKKCACIEPKRALVLPFGGLIISSVMQRIGAKSVTLSVASVLDGYKKLSEGNA